MKAPLTHMLDEWARNAAPLAMTMVLVLLAVLHLPVPGFAHLAPMLPVMAIFHWSLHRPVLLPYWAVFVIGLLVDALTGGTLGFNALMLLFVSAFVRAQSRYVSTKGFFTQWLAFMVVVAVFETIRWLLMGAIAHGFHSLWPAALRVLLAMALYPCVSWFLLRVDQAFLKQA